MKITHDGHSTMHSIIQRAERARAAFVGIALKEDEGITKLVTHNTDVHKSKAEQRLNGERFIATIANNEKIVVDPISGSRRSLITRDVCDQKNQADRSENPHVIMSYKISAEVTLRKQFNQTSVPAEPLLFTKMSPRAAVCRL